MSYLKYKDGDHLKVKENTVNTPLVRGSEVEIKMHEVILGETISIPYFQFEGKLFAHIIAYKQDSSEIAYWYDCHIASSPDEILLCDYYIDFETFLMPLQTTVAS